MVNMFVYTLNIYCSRECAHRNKSLYNCNPGRLSGFNDYITALDVTPMYLQGFLKGINPEYSNMNTMIAFDITNAAFEKQKTWKTSPYTDITMGEG